MNEEQTLEAGAGDAPVDDLRSQLEAAFESSDETGVDIEPAVEPDGQPRAPDGKFAAKQQEAEPETAPEPAEAPVVDQEQPETETAAEGASLTPPPGWSVEAKTAFDTLPDAVKAAVAQREQEVNQGFAKLQDYKGLDPYVDMARSNGKDLSQVVQAYMNAEDLLQKDFVGGVKQLCQFYNVTPEQLASQLGGQPAEGETQQHLNPLLERINSLEGMVRGQVESQTQAERTRVENETSAFFADPANKYASNVSEEMAALIKSGKAGSLKEAYDAALWLNPETRQLLINEQVNARSSAEADQAQAATEKAKAAAKSVTGSPLPGANPDTSGPAQSLREELEQAFAAGRA